MREQSVVKLIDSLTLILDGAVKNVPPYVSDLMFRYSMYSLSLSIFGLIITWLWIWTGYKTFKSGDFEVGMGLWVATMFLLSIWISVLFCNIQWVFLPELSMLEYLKH